MTSNQLYFAIAFFVIVCIVSLGAGAAELARSIWGSPHAQELSACRETCRPWSVQEFHSDNQGNTTCICSE